ncbi:MAG: hypothetical protein N4A74_07480 [Carboxylicivirga sp.]|jgi:F0F1-type ATP synthase assembly protein I|nr:hypothetical protein [Carboxylicivirga sp.]
MANLNDLIKAFSEDPNLVKDRRKKTASEIKAEQLEHNENQNRRERKRYAVRTFWLVVGYIGCVLLIVVFAGLEFLKLSDTILLALIVTSFAKIIGLFVFVMKYLFKI